MPQGPIAVAAVNLIPQGAKNSLNITAATVVKAAPGTLLGIQVLVAGSGLGSVNDCTTVAAVATANQVAVVEESVTTVPLPPNGFPCKAGIVVTPGTGQTLAVAYV